METKKMTDLCLSNSIKNNNKNIDNDNIEKIIKENQYIVYKIINKMGVTDYYLREEMVSQGISNFYK